MLTVRFGNDTYELDLEAALKGLTGAETLMVEDFLGGWDKFRSPSNVTRSTVVIVWLAKKHAGGPGARSATGRGWITFDEILATPGLVFGDVVELTDDEDNTDAGDGQSPPADAAALNSSPRLSDVPGSRSTLASTG
jgi:hypothetical protein